MVHFSKFSSQSGGWWHKDINPIATLIILTVTMVIIFIMGANFMREYIKIWTNISREGRGEGYQKQNIEDLLLPY